MSENIEYSKDYKEGYEQGYRLGYELGNINGAKETFEVFRKEISERIARGMYDSKRDV